MGSYIKNVGPTSGCMPVKTSQDIIKNSLDFLNYSTETFQQSFRRERLKEP